MQFVYLNRISLKLNTQTTTKSLYLQITSLKTLRQSLYFKIFSISSSNRRPDKGGFLY